MHVKICGINSLGAGQAAAEAGADALGFVFADSPRRVTPLEASRIAAQLPKGIDRVAVFRRPHPGAIDEVLEMFAADVVQADHSYLDPHVSARLLPVFREGMDTEETIDEYLERSADRRLLYEGPKSGVGQRVEVGNAGQVAERSLMTLAGGLNPGNVVEAIRAVAPYGVDVSSGVESSPGVKDPSLIREFIENIRSIEKEVLKV